MSLKQIIILILIILGLILGLYLVKQPQIFKSRATTNIYDAFDITDDQGNKIYCSDNICTTHSLNINLKITDPALLNQ